MLKLPVMILFALGLVFATTSSAQDRREPERQESRGNLQKNLRAERAEPSRGVTSERYPSRSSRSSESMSTPRFRSRQQERRGDDERGSVQQVSPGRNFGRDPRAQSYRTRPFGSEPSANVPRDLQRAIERAQSTHGGKVLSADRIRYRGQDNYRVKLLTPDGRVRVVQLSEQPENGQAPSDFQTKGDD